MSALKYFGMMIATSGVAGIILAILAPYGTFQMSLSGRLFFWIGLCMAGGMGAGSVETIILKTGWKTTSWQRVLAQSFGATLAVWVCFLALLIYNGANINASFYYVTPFYIWIIAAIICSVGELMDKHSKRRSDSSVQTRPAIIDRIKPSLRQADIYALSAEDHYVRVHTSNGDDLVLMRLSDAIKETVPLVGLQTHRSWWVAEKGIKGANTSNGKMTITLHTDISTPVSRANMKAVRELGWG